MMQILRAISALTIFMVAIFNSNKLLGTIRLNEVMSSSEQKKTGISELTPLQKQELERWINETFVLKTVGQTDTLPYLEQNLQNGSQLKLSDGSIYIIAPTDQAKTSFWLTPIPLKISSSQDHTYPVLLTNTLTGESAKAKQIHPARPRPQPHQ
jgi:hypothetical protein